jgi:hypothetical protein
MRISKEHSALHETPAQQDPDVEHRSKAMYQNHNPSREKNPTTRSNIVGATGLSRASLAALFRANGLFGADSELSAAEQAVVQAGLPRIAGLKPGGSAARNTPRLAALADYVAALVAGRSAIGERARVEAAGLSSRAAGEAETVVGDVFAVFQPEVLAPAAKQPALVEPRYARAA